MELRLGSVLKLLVLKNDAECTSQRLKWTSGARVMIIFGRSVARSFAQTELLRGFEFRITDQLRNYLGGSNFELMARAIFISQVFEFRIIFCRNYDRTFSLFQGVSFENRIFNLVAGNAFCEICQCLKFVCPILGSRSWIGISFKWRVRTRRVCFQGFYGFKRLLAKFKKCQFHFSKNMQKYE